MSKVSFEIPAEVYSILEKHKQLHWDSIISNLLWQYAKKLHLMDVLTSKSKLKKKDVKEINKLIKDKLWKRYNLSKK